MLKLPTVYRPELNQIPEHIVNEANSISPGPDNVRYGNSPVLSPSSHAPSEVDVTYEAGFFTHLKATLRRQAIQKSRMPCSLILEFVLPILFILVLVLTSLASETVQYKSEQFVKDTNSLDPMATFVSSNMCYNNSIPGYKTPQEVKDLLSVCEPNINPICAEDDQLPKGIRGICVRNMLGIFSITALKSEVRVPSFDNMVLVQWAARALFGGGPTGQLTLTDPSISLRINGYLYFYPKNDAVDTLVNKMSTSHKLFKYVYGGTHGSRAEIVNKIKSSKEGYTWAIVGMESTNPEDLAIELSLNRSAVPYTSRVRPMFPSGGEGESQYTYYYTSGFLTLQKTLLGKYYSEIEDLGDAPYGPIVSMVPMGYADWELDVFLSIAGSMAPLVMVLAFLYTVSQLAKRLVEEKELRLREGTHVMGLSKAAFFSSWLIIYYIQIFVISIVISLILKVSIMSQSDVTLIFTLFFAFSIAVINMAALLSTFFNSSNITVMVVPLLYFVLAIPSFALPQTTPELVYVVLSLLFCPIPFSIGMQHFFTYEMNNGAGWSDAASNVAKPFNMMAVIAFLLWNSMTYLLLMIYFDNVIPKEWGTTHHPLFCFCYFWRSKKNKRDEDDVECSGPRAKHGVPKDSIQDYPGPSSESTLQIRHLMKEFTGSIGQKVKIAVNDLDLKIFPNSITVLLGHNGAGKTTVMNMITGMMNMTHGDITVYGKSVKEDLAGVRQSIGYCPQHNILWDTLTCMEHLQYFARLKGVPAKMVDIEAQRMLCEVDLQEKSGTRTGALSGGQKRKLSVAIAFVGNSKLILLDEPTAGMDVGARRHTWELLKNMSTVGNRTVLLTTHFMDEADLLGSRIAIMSQGALHSYGTPMHLKNKLGTGYVLKLSSSVPIAEPNGVLREIQEYIPEASVKEIKGQELSIALPKTTSKRFPEVIRVMESDEMAEKYNITSISMSVSTLEDVFLKIGYDEEMMADDVNTGDKSGDQELLTLSDSGHDVNITFIPNDTNNHFSVLKQVYIDQQKRRNEVSGSSCFGSFIRQLNGLFLKRFHYARRDFRAIIIQIVLPVFCILIGISTANVGPPKQHKLDIGMSQWGGEPQMIALNNCSNLKGLFTEFTEVDEKDYAYALNFSNYLVDTANEHGQAERSAAVYCGNDGLNGSNTNLTSGALVFHNSTMRHSAPFALIQYYTALARQSANNKLINIRIYSSTMPLSEREEDGIAVISSLLIALFVLIPLTFIPSTYVGYIVKERASKSKHLQFVSGAQFIPYWLSNILFDFLSFLVTTIIALIMFCAFEREELIGDARTFGATTSLLLLYGLSGISSAYLVSFLFKDHSSAQNMVLLVNFMCGFVLVITYYIISALESTKEVSKKLVFAFRLMPAFCVGEGIITMSSHSSAKKLIDDLPDIFSTEFIGWPLIYMTCLFAVTMTLVLIIDYPKLQGLIAKFFVGKGTDEANSKKQIQRSNSERRGTVTLLGDNAAEDGDVAIEREIIENDRRPGDVVVVKRLKKKFGDIVAVDGLSFGVKNREVFGFLGTNGAGKSTTMSMLTGELLPTAGYASVCGFNVLSQLKDCQKVIGYCPQFDAIIDKLTPDEHLNLYSSLRLIPAGKETKELVDVMIECCDLKQYRGIPAGKLSGGNKRKLSVAISLIGGPSVVFLDEPSAGMDPGARRKLWDVIILVAKQASVVLTTHHLEEVDVLAHRVGIMDHGKMKCLGPLERLKHKFGDGFELNIYVHDEAACIAFMQASFPEAILTENMNGHMIYTIPFTSVKLSDLFQSIQEARDANQAGITDYTVQQTSLERVFLRIQAASTENEEVK